MPTTQQHLDSLYAKGFDASYALGRDYCGRFSKAVRLMCSQCEACVINGVACHETGCPNETHECHGCNAIVPRRVRYCEECQ